MIPRITQSRFARRISHREIIGSINGSVGFTVNSFHLNPGVASTFTWLATQASGWEQYTFVSLKLEYVTCTATSTVGSVILSPEYDPTEPEPTTEAEAVNTMDSVEDAAWKTFSCDLSHAAMFPTGPRKYVRTGMVSGDLRTYDVGVLHVCTVGMAGTSMVGKLWADYTIDLCVPQSSIPLAMPTHALVATGNHINFVSGTEATVGFGTGTSTILFNTLHATFVAGEIRLPRGVYNIRYPLQITFTGTTGLYDWGCVTATTGTTLISETWKSWVVPATASKDEIIPLDIVAFFPEPALGTANLEISAQVDFGSGAVESTDTAELIVIPM
jgi:hypothetical protein